MVQYLTRQGNLYERLKPLAEPIEPRGKQEFLDVQLESPLGDLLQAHPLTAQVWARGRAWGLLSDEDDLRWRYDRKPTPDKKRARSTFMLDFAARVFGDLEPVWQEFYDLAASWGAIAGQFWEQQRNSVLRQRWEAFSDTERMTAETEIMEYFGIAQEYPSRNTRRNTLFMHVHWWLCGHFTDRILATEALRLDVAQATDRRLQPKYCGVCGREYRELQFWPYLLDIFGDRDGCCLGCTLAQPDTSDLPRLIRNLIDACGFVPEARTYFESRPFIERLGPERFLPAAVAYSELGGLQSAGTAPGDWMRAVIASGAVGDNVWVTKRGYRCVANDGDICLSLDELAIDNWLSGHRLDHTKEPRYPLHPELNPKGGLRADWKVGEVYVEYFGLAGDPTYDRKIEQKRLLAQATGITLLPIYPIHMRDLDGTLAPLLS